MNMGLGKSALDAYVALSKQNPDDALYTYLLGRATADADAARAAYNRALDLDPSLGRAWMGLGAVDRAEQKMDDALVKYQKALALDPSLAEAWTVMRYMALGAGDRNAALRLAQEAMSAVPNDPDAYLHAAQLQPELAAAYLAKGALAVPDEPKLHAALGEALFAAGDLEGAAEAYRNVLAIVPGSPRATLNLALVEARLSGALSSDGAALLERGRQLARQGKAAEARSALDTAVKQHPDTFLSWYARGNVLVEHHEVLGGDAALATAEEDLQRAYALAPESPDVQATLGLLLLQRDKPSYAAPLLANASMLRSSDVQLSLAAAQAYAAIPDDPRGVPMLITLTERFPMDSRTYLALASALSDRGEATAAYEALVIGIQRTGNAALVVALAAASVDLGQTEQAAALLQQLGEQGGSQAFLDAAAKLRQSAPPTE